MTCDRSVVFSGDSTNTTDHHDIAEILLNVALNTINQTKQNRVTQCYIIHLLIGMRVLASLLFALAKQRVMVGVEGSNELAINRISSQ